MTEASCRSNYLCKLEQDSPVSLTKTEPAQSETETPSACPRKLPHKSINVLLPDSTILQTNNRQQWDLALEMKATCPVWQPTCFTEVATAAIEGKTGWLSMQLPRAGLVALKPASGDSRASALSLDPSISSYHHSYAMSHPRT